MSVRLKYAGDKDISAGRSGGASIFSLPVPAGFPAAGTILNTLNDVVFPVSEGGSYGTWQDPFELSSYYPLVETVDVYVKADGSGGSYTDWVNYFDKKYIAYGVVLQYGTWTSNQYQISTNCNATQYVTDGEVRAAGYSEGNGGIYTGAYEYRYLMSFGTQVYYESCDDGSGNYIDTYYYSDGNGYYYT